MKDIGSEIGVNESRVSQLHARAIQRLRVALGSEAEPKSAMRIIREAVAAFKQKPKMLKAQLATVPATATGVGTGDDDPGVPDAGVDGGREALAREGTAEGGGE